MSSLFERLGYSVARTLANAKCFYDAYAGSDEESVRAEVLLGRGLAEAMRGRIRICEDAALTESIAGIGRKLVGHLKDRRRLFVFQVMAGGPPNAFALPGGPVFVSQALLELCRRQPDEIAFVLGHEMAHIAHRHTLERVLADSVFSALIRRFSVGRAAGAWLGKAGLEALTRAHSRENEFEADAFAQRLAATAGFAPDGGVRLLQRLAQTQPPGALGELSDYFSSHPSPVERVERLRSAATA